MAAINEVGNRYGKLVVLERDYSKPRSQKNAYWLCQCDCGNTTIVLGNKLRKGETKSCGCLRKEAARQNVVDIIGQRFGHLTVLERAGSTSTGLATWLCQCDCGNTTIVTGAHLRDGHTTSCGCYQKEVTSTRASKDISNQRFGRLIAIEPTDKRRGTNTIWKCKCDCGNYCEVDINSLTQSKISSCGCLTSSKGEDKIIRLLKENNIPFETQKSFTTCRSNITNRPFRFDFYVNNQYLIEFDGRQHYAPGNSGWNTKENFEKTKENDSQKNEWCKNNKVPLIRIPYWYYDNLTIDDLKLETSNFIYKGEE